MLHRVAVIGAGPYGLSVAAHLRAAGTEPFVVGDPMSTWRDAMPPGMQLRSPVAGSSLSDPDGRWTLPAYCAELGRAVPAGPLPRRLFLGYASWFAACAVGEVAADRVTDVDAAADGFRLRLAGGREVSARAVVLATGPLDHAYVPGELAGLPADACAHASVAGPPERYRGVEVAVLGAGQSALEAAALLAEAGAARVTVLGRTPRLRWTPQPGVDRVRGPVNGLGKGWATWAYVNAPDVFRRLPQPVRAAVAQRALGPAGAWWLRPRLDRPEIDVRLGRRPVRAEHRARRVEIECDTGEVLHADRVIAATGYRVRPDRMVLLAPALRHRLGAHGPWPRLDADFQSAWPGLFLVGLPAAGTFGPVQRFVVGAGLAARRVSRALAPAPGRRS